MVRPGGTGGSLKALALLALCTLVAASPQRPSATVEVGDAPIFWLAYDGGGFTLQAMKDRRQPEAAPIGNLVIAIWDDGTVVRATSWEQPGKHLNVETIDPAQLQEIRERLGAASLERFDQATYGLAKHRWVMHQGGEQPATLYWTELIGSAPLPLDTERFRSFVSAWFDAKITAASARSAKSVPLAERIDASGRFRGISPDSRNMPDWMKPAYKSEPLR
jgi:hypothetical protein